MRPRRPYRTALRDSQAEATRERILRAAAAQIGDPDLPGFSIERIAERAGVSVRTVFYHFASRAALLDALRVWGEAQIGADAVAFPDRIEDVPALVERAFARFDAHETLIRAQLATAPGRELRVADRSRRQRLLGGLVGAIRGLDPGRRRDAIAVIHYLASSEAWRSLKDESGMTGAEAGRAIRWAVEVLLTDLKARAASTGRGARAARTSRKEQR